MAKPIQYCKVINLQLNKFIFKKNAYKEAEKKSESLYKVENQEKLKCQNTGL